MQELQFVSVGLLGLRCDQVAQNGGQEGQARQVHLAGDLREYLLPQVRGSVSAVSAVGPLCGGAGARICCGIAELPFLVV